MSVGWSASSMVGQAAHRCRRCGLDLHSDVPACPICGTPRPAEGWGSRQDEELPRSAPEELRNVLPHSLPDLLARHEGERVRINFGAPDKVQWAWLAAVRDDYVTAVSRGRLVHTPLRWVLAVIEANGEPCTIVLHHEEFLRGFFGVTMPMPMPHG